MLRKILTFIILSMLLASCGRIATTSETKPAGKTAVGLPTQGEPPTVVPTLPELYVSIVWHQHQPFYATDPETGLVAAPWVRLHAAKDYVDMLTILDKYPQIHATFNLTPSLIKQLDDLAAGKHDIAWEMTLVPADELTTKQKTYLLERFFDTNGKVIARFPRYEELLDKRGGTAVNQIDAAIAKWSAQDFRDLQVLFNLAWTDPDFLAASPLAELAARGRDFTEADKKIVLDLHESLIKQVIPLHAAKQQSGQIEVTTTPYSHPILPLLIDTDLARIAVPDIVLPSRFSYGRDAVEQLTRGIALYESHFGQLPEGIWPAEGSVAEEIIGPVYRTGIKWILTDEVILAKSIGADFTRDANDMISTPELLYRPYAASERNDQPVAIFFRDTTLSNNVSFDYSQIPANEAVADFMAGVHSVRDAVKAKPGGPFVLTVILDGENAWEWYDNDGKDFLNGVYSALSSDQTIQTVTPSEFLELNQTPLKMIDTLFAGSWDGGDFKTWIGEQEENKAWGYLSTSRAVLEEYLRGVKKGQVGEDNLAQAVDAMLAAEGSDWFWWFGTDKDSGNDPAFDYQFRETLGQMYDALDLPRPEYLTVPIIYPIPIEPQRPLTALSSPVVDGKEAAGEWTSAGSFQFGETSPTRLAFAFSKELLSLRIESPPEDPYSIYLKVPAIQLGAAFSEEGHQVMGMDATHRLEVADGKVGLFSWNGTTWESIEGAEVKAVEDVAMEISFPQTLLWPTLDTGDALIMRIATNSILLPDSAPGRMLVPDLGRITWMVNIDDIVGDDHGPGNYVYPSDGVFVDGVLDLVNFKAGTDEESFVFRIEMRGPVDNPWGSPNGLAIQTVDIYIDVDGSNNGTRLLRNARNTAFTSNFAWDYAITAAGWNSGFFTAADPEIADPNVSLTIITDPGRRNILVKIPRGSISGDMTNWAFGVAVYSQDGYGPNNIREILPVAERWRVGGAPQGVTNYTRIMDYLWRAGDTPTQEEMLSNYVPQSGLSSDLSADEFPLVQMIRP